MTGPADEEVLLRVRLGDEVSRPARVASEGIHNIGSEARRTSAFLEEQRIQTERLARAERDLAVAQELQAHAARKSYEERLSASQATGKATKEVMAAKAALKSFYSTQQSTSSATDDNTRRFAAFHAIVNKATGGVKLADTAFGKWLSKLLKFKNLLKLIKFEAILAGIRLLIVALGALGVGAFAAIAGLTPLAGLLALYPGIAMAAVTAFGVLKAATFGFSQTLKDMASNNWSAAYEDLAKLSPVARNVAMQFDSLRVRVLKPLQQQLQEHFFAGVATDVGGLESMLNAVSPILIMVADTLGKLAAGFERLAGESGFQADLQKNLGTANFMIEHMGNGLLSFIDGINHVMTVLAPFFQWFAIGFEKAARTFDNWVHSARGENEITKFFQSTMRVAKMAWEIIKNFFFGFVNAGRAANVTSHMMGVGLLNLSKRFREWTGSVAGKNKMVEYFTKANVTLKALGHLFGDIFRMFGRLTADQGIAKFIDMLDQKLLPAIEKLLKSGASSTFIQGIISVAAAFANLFAVFNDSGITGLLGVSLLLFGGMLQGIADALDAIPKPLLRFIGGVITLLLLMKQIKKLIIFISVLRGIAAAMFTLDAAMLANPVGLLILLIVGAIADLIGIIYLLMKHWQGVMAFFGSIGSVFKSIFGFVIDLFHKFANVIENVAGDVKGVWDFVANALSMIWNGLGESFKALGAVFNWVWDHSLGPVFRALKTAVGWLSGAWSIIKATWDMVKGAFKVVLGSILGSAGGTGGPPGHIIGGPVPGQDIFAPQIAPGNGGGLGSGVHPRAKGGPVDIFNTYLVGEIGPEIYKTPFGSSFLGLNGPELVKFSAPGVVIPNSQIDTGKLASEFARASAGSKSQNVATLESGGTTKQEFTIEGDRNTITIEANGIVDLEKKLAEFYRKRDLDKGRKIHWLSEGPFK